MDLLQGRNELLKHLLVPNKGEVDADLRLNDIIVNKSQIKMITDVNELLNDFNNLCNASPKQMCARMEWEAEEELLEASSAKATHGRTMPASLRQIDRKKMYASIINENTKENGYICWLLDANGRAGLPPLSELKPTPFNPGKALESISNSISGMINALYNFKFIL